MIDCVEKPELFILSKPEDHFLKARCSACSNVRFNILGNGLSEKRHLRTMFDIHVRQVHVRDNQAKDSAK
jgi:hypothetical protein